MTSIEDVRKKLLDSAVKVGNSIKTNKTLLSNEESIVLFNENLKEIMDRCPDEYYKPDNYDEIVDEIFSMKNVYVATTPCEDHFSESGEWVGEYPTHTFRSLDEREIINSINYYINQGAVVYLYLWFQMKQGLVVGFDYKKNEPIINNDVNTYYWRMFAKKI
jgi:hypothetical protein